MYVSRGSVGMYPSLRPPPGQGSVGMGCAEGLPPYRFVSRFPVNHWWGLFYLSINHYDSNIEGLGRLQC